MKYSWSKFLNAAFFLVAVFGLAIQTRADVIITQGGKAELGNLVEKPNGQITFSFSSGVVSTHKSQLLWHCADPAADTFLKAAKKAIAEKEPLSIIYKLLDASVEREPATAKEARAIKEKLEAKIIEKLQETALIAKLQEPLSLSLPNPIIQMGREPEGPTVRVDVNYRNTDFVGFINYNTYAVAGDKLHTFTIPMPVFSTFSINTSVVVGSRPLTTTVFQP